MGGLIGGTTAVHGLQQNRYGPPDSPALFSSKSSETNYAGSESDGGYESHGPANCSGCSERDLGYRWAMLASVRSSDQCPSDSWGFRRGCLDYTGGA